jgi:hypothetical protein
LIHFTIEQFRKEQKQNFIEIFFTDGVDKVATHESQNENPENQSQPKTENLSKDFNNEKQEL